MYGIFGVLAVMMGVPLCALAVIGAVIEYPYLIVIPVWAGFLVRRGYKRAKKRFQADVALARLGAPRGEQVPHSEPCCRRTA